LQTPGRKMMGPPGRNVTLEGRGKRCASSGQHPPKIHAAEKKGGGGGGAVGEGGCKNGENEGKPTRGLGYRHLTQQLEETGDTQ